MQVRFQEKINSKKKGVWGGSTLFCMWMGLKKSKLIFCFYLAALSDYHCPVKAFLAQKGDDWRNEELQKDCCKEVKLSLLFVSYRSRKKQWTLATPRHAGKALARWDPLKCGQWRPRNYFPGRLQSSCHSRSVTAVYAEVCQKLCCPRMNLLNNWDFLYLVFMSSLFFMLFPDDQYWRIQLYLYLIAETTLPKL